MTVESGMQPGVPPPTIPSPSSWQLQASTGNTPFPLQNGTPTLVTWTPPNDGALHGCLVVCTVHTTSGETGGAMAASYTSPDGGSVGTPGLQAGGAGVGVTTAQSAFLCEGGQPVSIKQSTALTAGAAVAWASIYGA
jgi:hypothetical protein